MAYNNYFPQNYYPQQYYPNNQVIQQMPQQTAQQSSSGGITWVQGEAAAKSFPVGAGQSVLLMDSEDSVMYIKATDQSGMPLPLRIFDYTERTQSGTNRGQSEDKPGTDDFVSRKEFDEFKEDVKRSIKGIRKPRITDEEEE